MSDLEVTHSFGVANTPKADAASSSMMRIAEQTAISEIQGMVVVAHRFPRDPVQAVNLILQDCQRLELAQAALYNFVRGGTDIEGPSIKLIKQIAIRWRNIKTGGGAVHVQDNKSYCRAWAYDLENNMMEERTFIVPHIRVTRAGNFTITDEREIDYLVRNIVQRNKRSCIEALIDADVIEAAVKQSKKTLTIKAEVTPERLVEMVKKFEAVGVSKSMIERRIQRSIEAMQPAMLIKLGTIYNTLRDGAGIVTDYFVHDDVVDMQPAGQSRMDQAKGKVKPPSTGKGKKADAPKPEAKPKADPVVVYAQIADAMQSAKTRDELNVAADNIRFMKDDAQREELEAMLEARLREFDEAAGNGDPLGGNDER